MSTVTTCHTCGKTLTHTDHGGLCGSCLYGALIHPTEGTTGEAPSGGWQVPGYAVGEAIARGGSSVVYRARQYVPPREVALKILLPTWSDGTAVRERFRIEAEALAHLDHPGILPVLASGEVDGALWYSMPLAEGGTLAERSGTVRGQFRLIAEWVAAAADAVGHAHARGVLHRDLKPGNLLFSDDGRIFVSDFGLARVLATPSDVTVTAAMLGTPAYMAPEVITYGTRAATIAADVWGLGAILYELLAGHRPFAAESIPDLVRAITSDNPASLRGVPFDLAAIALHALHKKPERRYATVTAMAEDLRAWLAGQPVSARPYPWWERLEFSARRHPWIASGIAVGLALGLTAIFVGASESRLLKREQAARRLADQEAATSREILKFLQDDLLAQASPEHDPDRALPLRTVLDRAAKKVDGRFPNQPLIEAAIRETLAWTYFALGDEPVAYRQANQAIALYTQGKGAETPEVLRLRHFEAYDDVMKGKMGEAEQLSSGVLAIQRRVLPASNPELYATWQDVIQIQTLAGKLEPAEKAARAALAAATANLGADHFQTIKLEYVLARVFGEQHRQECLPMFRDALERARRTLGPDHSFTLTILADFGVTLADFAQPDESLAMGRELLAARNRVLGPTHPETLLTAINVASSLSNRGDLKEADELFRHAETAYGARFAPDDRRMLQLNMLLVQHWFRMGRYRSAIDVGVKTQAVLRRTLGPHHVTTQVHEICLSAVYAALGDNDAVVALLQPLVEFAQSEGKSKDEFTVVAQLLLANVERDRGNSAEAAVRYRAVDENLPAENNDPGHVRILKDRFAAQLEILQGHFHAAELVFGPLGEAHVRQLGATEQRTLQCKLDLCELRLMQNELPVAREQLQELVAAREAAAGLDALPTLRVLDAFGIEQALEGKWTDAEQTFRRTGEHWPKLEAGDFRTAMNRVYLGWVLYAEGQHDAGEALLETARPAMTDPKLFTPGERVLRSLVCGQLADAYQKAGNASAASRWRALIEW